MSTSMFRIAAFGLAMACAPFSAPFAQDDARRTVISRDADYFGHDYAVRKDVEVDQCQAECEGDAACRAFTYNVSARWCFLKSEVGELRAVAGAVSGRIVTEAAEATDLSETRAAELDFLGRGPVDQARRYAAGIAAGAPARGTAEEWIRTGLGQHNAGEVAAAVASFREALNIDPGDHEAWAVLAGALAGYEPRDWQQREQARRDAVSAAINAYLRARTDRQRRADLATLGLVLGASQQWKAAIRAYRASLALGEDQGIRDAYSAAVAEHGFRLVQHRVDSDAPQPQICLVFSDDLGRNGFNPEEFVTVGGGVGTALEAGTREICIDGVEHGERYAVTVRKGVPAADGERLEQPAVLDIFVRDRSSTVRFPGTAYILPGHDGATIPIVTINTDRVEAHLYRVGDRSLARTIGDGEFLSQLNQYESDQIPARTGEKVWSGSVEVESVLNREVVTAIPVAAMVSAFQPGAYVLVAQAASDARPWEAKATQWFVVTDLGLSSYAGSDGLHVMARSLTSAEPLAGLALRLVAVNNQVLGTATTDDTGLARFDPGLIRGSQGMAPALVAAEDASGDYAFLDLKRSQLDLTDRGVEGRPAPGPIDVFLTTERGIYRPAETVFATMLARDSRGAAIPDLPLTLIVTRPDGKEAERRLIGEQAAGGAVSVIGLPAAAMRGTWRIAVHADPEATALAETAFLVEDFLPERLDFSLSSAAPDFAPGAPPEVSLKARFLYGAPASGLAVYGRTAVEAVRTVPGHPGFVFGLADEEAAPVSAPIEEGRTDADGAVVLDPTLPPLPAATRPMVATILAQVEDGSGRPVERSLSLPVADTASRLGLKPLFEGAAGENSSVRFAAIAVDDAGRRIPATDVAWTLSAVETAYQWYQADSQWSYEVIRHKRRVAGGTIDIGADDPTTIEAAVGWGGYELTLEAPAGTMLPVSHRFEAGWYVEQKSLDSPQALKLALDKREYRIGERAEIRITPPFAGKAEVLVVDDRIIARHRLDVPAEGATVSLPVTAEWGAGAYVTATVFRPMDLGSRRMPARAVGLAWAAVDPQQRRLGVAISADAVVRPRGSTTVRVTVEGAEAGEPAFVTLAAVDAGILNLTGFETPDPERHYFGQRRLGVEIRDFYNQLIDRMQGTAGRVRSGGDASAMRFEGPPPPEVIMAFHSGVQRVGADGSVEIEVPLPDFNGTVRLMAIAWTRLGVGHGEREIVVRDPVVVTTSGPRFLAPGDRSRLLVEVADTEGLGGVARLTVSADGATVMIPPGHGVATLDLGAGDRAAVRVPVTAGAVGEAVLEVSLTLADGTVLDKTVAMAVRDNEPAVTRARRLVLDPGQRLVLDADLLAGLRPDGAEVTVTASGAGGLDLVGIVRSLDRYPYGCAEQLTSRALPLLYLDRVILAAGLDERTSVTERVQEAIGAVLGFQAAEGGFGLWGPGSGDLWLDAYVTDFLGRARDRGYRVPDQGFDLALDNLKNRLAYTTTVEGGGADIAYAVYVLARHGRASIGDIRYYAGAELDNFDTPLAKAQLAAALMAYGDRPRAEEVFGIAVADLASPRDDSGRRSDYGTPLRDNAAVLTVAVEAASDAVDRSALRDRLQAAWSTPAAHSTQEQAWSLLAAHALGSGDRAPRLSLEGTPVTGPLYRRLDAAALAGGVAVVNEGSAPVELAITARGTPTEPEPAGGAFATIERRYYTLDGSPAEPQAIGQGDRLVAVVSVLFNDDANGQIIIDDPLPAGLEIDNPALIRSGEIEQFAWLDLKSDPAHMEFRDDRFIVALDRSASAEPRVELAYVVRAVTPGLYRHPAAIVEDMYRPERSARTGSGTVEVVGPLR